MAKSSIGKTVSRVGASGGGKTYAKARPANYYAVLALIVILGLSAIVYSRYERQHPSTPVVVYPAVGATGFAGSAVDACGVAQPGLLPQKSLGGSFDILASQVVQVAPKTASVAGNNATLSAMIAAIPGLSFSSTKMTIPGIAGVVSASGTYVAGTKCATGTKFAGQAAYPVIAYWKTIAQKTPTLTTSPSSVKFTPYMLFTFAFVPKGAKPKLPSSATVSAMFRATPSVTTTTLPLTTTTLANVTTTTLAPVQSTTTTTSPKG